MSFRPSNFLFWALIIVCIWGVSFDTLMLITNHFSKISFATLILTQFVWLPIVPVIIFGRQFLSLIVINEKGISLRLYWRNIAHIPWAEMAEVGIGYHFGPGCIYNWFYFSRRHLSDDEVGRMQIVKQTNEIMKIWFTKRVLKAVQKYYTGEIKNLSDKTKNVNNMKIFKN